MSALPGGRTQTGTFSGGRFEVRQDARAKGTVDVFLRGPVRCSSRTLASTAKRRRGLWGRDHGGRFRTHGADSVATVRGTRWYTEDRCDGTLTRVTEGSVVVCERHRKRTKVVTAGRRYLARR